jgi:hypothetical protein
MGFGIQKVKAYFFAHTGFEAKSLTTPKSLT